MKTNIKRISIDWTEIKNECRHTDNKEDTSNCASEEFVKKLLISEHSPIRLGRIKWSWDGIKSWISVHFARHFIGWEKWISTQRTDRTGVNRDKSPQDTPVNMDVEANIQSIINVSRYRLCTKASKETREYMMDLKSEIKEKGKDYIYLEDVSKVMVPNCIYRMGCPEFDHCENLNKFYGWCFAKGYDAEDMFDIQLRYDLYNEYFYSEVYKK